MGNSDYSADDKRPVFSYYLFSETKNYYTYLSQSKDRQSSAMHQARLNDAAIALSRVLDRAGITFGIFGGYAIAAHGGQRESKDIDCLAAVTKQQILDLLDGKQGFVAVPQTREDYVALLWSDKPNRQNAVLVEIFCEQFPG
jgi:hypothetical protein